MASDKKKNIDVKAELLRLIGCFMVILIHIRIQPLKDGTILKTPVFIGCLLTSSVGLFFLVSGFFMYSGRKTWWGTAKSFLVRILTPTLIVVFLTLVFNNWIMGQSSLIDCVKSADYLFILKSMKEGVFHLSSDYWGLLCAHLWYIAEYARLILFFPAIAILVKYADNRILLYLAGLNVVFCFMIDLYRLFGQFSFPYVEPFLRASQALVLCGYLLYRQRGRLKEKPKNAALLFAAYAASVLWMFFSQMKQFATEGGDWTNAYYTTWLSGIGIISAILLAAFVLSLPDDLKIWKWIEKPVLFFGGLSFPIYLVQYAIIMKFATRGIAGRFTVMTGTAPGTVAYYLVYGLLIFFLSALVAYLMRLVSAAVLFLMQKATVAIDKNKNL